MKLNKSKSDKSRWGSVRFPAHGCHPFCSARKCGAHALSRAPVCAPTRKNVYVHVHVPFYVCPPPLSALGTREHTHVHWPLDAVLGTRDRCCPPPLHSVLKIGVSHVTGSVFGKWQHILSKTTGPSELRRPGARDGGNGC